MVNCVKFKYSSCLFRISLSRAPRICTRLIFPLDSAQWSRLLLFMEEMVSAPQAKLD